MCVCFFLVQIILVLGVFFLSESFNLFPASKAKKPDLETNNNRRKMRRIHEEYSFSIRWQAPHRPLHSYEKGE